MIGCSLAIQACLMEMETGKLFVGGISWETNEERLREYFQTYGEVVEAIVMRDRATGRSRGFGFVVFANASAAEKVVKERHIINGRTVEAKKAVPRDDHQNSNRNNGSIQGSPGPARTKKIFVGGLASTVTESDFKAYFEQFGMITDIVVMYDHNTQRPRGFGFITYDSEEAVDKVLIKTFHELNGKMVEVKRAVPKELSPGPTRSPSNNGLNRANSFLNAYTQGYVTNSPSGYGTRTDGRFSPVTVGRSGYPPYNLGNQRIGLNMDSGFGLNYGNSMNSCFSGNLSQYDSPVSYGGNSSLFSATNRNVWGNGNPSYGTASLTTNDFVSSRIGNTSSFGHIGDIWSRSSSRDNVYGWGENNIGGRAGFTQNNGANNVLDSGIDNLSENDSFYSRHAWHLLSTERQGFSPFGYGHGNAPSANGMTDNSVGLVGNYNVPARSNKGIAA